MSDVPPVVRMMLLCDDIEHDPANPNKINVLGLTHVVRAPSDESYPYLLRQLTVYLLLAGARGPGLVSVAGSVYGDERRIFHTRPRPVQFSRDPLTAQGLVFRVQQVTFPGPGLYSIRFVCDGEELSEHLLFVQ